MCIVYQQKNPGTHMQCLISHTVFFSNDFFFFFFISGAWILTWRSSRSLFCVQPAPTECVVKPGLFASSPRVPFTCCVCVWMCFTLLYLCVRVCVPVSVVLASVCWERAHWNPNIWLHTLFWGGGGSSPCLSLSQSDRAAETRMLWTNFFSLVVVLLCIIL